MHRIPIALFTRREKAEPIRDRLHAAGLPAEIHHEAPLEKLWFVSHGSGGVRLEVPAKDFDRAEGLLLEWDAAHPLDGAIHCPECRSLRVEYPQFARKSFLTNLAVGAVAQMGLVEKDFFCHDCHYTWPKEGTGPSRSRPHMAPHYFIEGIATESPPSPGEHKRAA
jgi:hypothetical protein